MNNHDHPQDTIDVKHLFENSPENLQFDPASSPTTAGGAPAANNSQQSAQMQNALDPNYVAPQTQNRQASFDLQNNNIDPEDLDDEEFDDEDEAAREKRRKILIISICAGVLTILIVLIGLIIWIASTGDSNGASNGNSTNSTSESVNGSSQIGQKVFAGNIDLSGKTLEQAKNWLHLKTDHIFSSESMTVKIPGGTLVLAPENTSAKLDVDAVALAALNCGTDGNPSLDGTYYIDLLDYLTLNTKYIKETVNDFCQENSTVLTDPTIKLEGSRPQFDPDAISSEYENQSLIITLGTPEYTLDAEDMYNQIMDAYGSCKMEVIYNGPQAIEPDTPDVDDLYEQYCTPAQDAILDPATYEITPEIYGYGFDVQELLQAIENANYGDTISITFKILKPEVLAADLNKNMFVDTLAEYQISSSMDDSKRNNNISLSCTALDGYVINAGDTFSFNDAIGKLSTKNGYATAPIGKFNGSVMGGGVSQTASALYVCALLADLDIMERHNHQHAVDFCELGLDAFVDGDTYDLRFKNNTTSPIRIIAEATGGKVRIEIVGIDTLEYEVEITPQTTKEIQPMTTYQSMDANNALGYADGDIIQDGITGYTVVLRMEKYDRTSKKLISSLDIAISEYEQLDEIVVRITTVEPDPIVPDDTTTTTPTDPTEDPTDPTEDPTDPTEESTDPTTETPIDPPTEENSTDDETQGDLTLSG